MKKDKRQMLFSRRSIMKASGGAGLAALHPSMASAATPTCMPLKKHALLRDQITNIYNLDEQRQRYAFTHMTELFRHSRVMASRPPRDLSIASDQDREVFKNLRFKTSRGEASFEQVSRNSVGCDGVIVLSHGSIVFEQYPLMNDSDCHLLMSTTKALVGTAITRFVDRGMIDIRATPADYISCLKRSGWARVPIIDVLNMTSGIEAVEHSPGATSDISNPYYDFEGSIGYIKPANAANTYDVVSRYKVVKQPGAVYEYSSVNTFMLGWLLEAVSGQPLNEVLSQEVWVPAGCATDAYLLVSPQGAPGADGGLSCTLRDLARVGQTLLESATGESGYLSSASFERIRRLGNRPAFLKAGVADSQAMDQPLFNSWQWDGVWQDGDLYKAGWGGQILYVSPASRTVICYVSTPRIKDREVSIEDWCRQVANRLRVKHAI